MKPIIASIARQIFERLHLDLLGELAASRRGNKFALTMIGSRSCFAAATPIPNKDPAIVMGALVEKWI